MITSTILFSILYIFIRTKENLHILQQNFYNENNRYIKWGNKNIYKVFRLDIIILIINILNIYINSKYLMILNIIYIILYFIENNNIKNIKIPLSITNRIKRIIFTLTIIYLIPIISYIFNNNIYLFNTIYSFIISFNFYIVLLCSIINIPIEKIIYLYYKVLALNKLKKFKDLIIVGITGSYGKTTTKNILNNILCVKYNSICTPKNYNTLYGLIITINKYLDKFDDIFIAEMGAYKRNRIKLLCKLVKPKYGIITSIGNAHLDTFHSIENIQLGKFELIENLKHNGIGILNGDDYYQVNYKIKNKVNIIWIGIDNKNVDLYADDITINKYGMKFNVYFTKENIKYTFTTKLLGKSNIYNILESIAFSRYIMNMDLNNISIGIKNIKPIEHRLELKKYNDICIIDDAYNSNPVGSSMSLDVLNLMDGFKIIVTPGMVELGDKEYILNKEFGKQISNVCDYVILVGKKQTKPILDGLIENNYNKDKIKIINDVKEYINIVKNIKSNNKYVLLENDLPDIYNE